jgi:hypothetical protein
MVRYNESMAPIAPHTPRRATPEELQRLTIPARVVSREEAVNAVRRATRGLVLDVRATRSMYRGR